MRDNRVMSGLTLLFLVVVVIAMIVSSCSVPNAPVIPTSSSTISMKYEPGIVVTQFRVGSTVFYKFLDPSTNIVCYGPYNSASIACTSILGR